MTFITPHTSFPTFLCCESELRGERDKPWCRPLIPCDLKRAAGERMQRDVIVTSQQVRSPRRWQEEEMTLHVPDCRRQRRLTTVDFHLVDNELDNVSVIVSVSAAEQRHRRVVYLHQQQQQHYHHGITPLGHTTCRVSCFVATYNDARVLNV